MQFYYGNGNLITCFPYQFSKNVLCAILIKAYTRSQIIITILWIHFQNTYLGNVDIIYDSPLAVTQFLFNVDNVLLFWCIALNTESWSLVSGEAPVFHIAYNTMISFCLTVTSNTGSTMAPSMFYLSRDQSWRNHLYYEHTALVLEKKTDRLTEWLWRLLPESDTQSRLLTFH